MRRCPAVPAYPQTTLARKAPPSSSFHRQLLQRPACVYPSPTSLWHIAADRLAALRETLTTCRCSLCSLIADSSELEERLHCVPLPSSSSDYPCALSPSPRETSGPSASFHISNSAPIPRHSPEPSRHPPTPKTTPHGVTFLALFQLHPHTPALPPCEFVPKPLLCDHLLTKPPQASRHHSRHRAGHARRFGPADARTAAGQHRQGPQGLHRGRHQPPFGVTEPLPERPAGSDRHTDARGRRNKGWRDAGRRHARRVATEQERPAARQASAA
jgi:hypothetical protein